MNLELKILVLSVFSGNKIMNKKFLMLLGFFGCFNANSVAVAEEVNALVGLSPAVIEQLNLSNKLIMLGDARKDTVLLIAGAKLKKNINVGADNNQQLQSVQTDDVLIRAKKYAGSNKVMVNLVEDVIAMRSKSYRLDCNGFHHGPCNEAAIY
jgi:hypothetical protein